MDLRGYRLPAGYRFTKRGLCGPGNSFPIANFYFCPVRSYQDQNERMVFYCDVEIVKTENRTPFQKRLDIRNLPASFWKKPPPGCCYYVGAQKPACHIQTLFQLLLNDLEPVQVLQSSTLGWRVLPSGEHVSVTGGGVIGPNGYLSSDAMWISNSLNSYQLETAPQVLEAEALQYFWTVFCAMPGITDILLVNSLSAFLIPCFKVAGIEPRFPVILEGPSESKKTTLACLTSGLYNRKTNLRSCMGTLTSTSRALELKAANLRHATLVFDDLFPDGGNLQERKVLELIRNIANQSPREARSGKTLTGSGMECGAVFTAEKFPNCGKSTRTRCLRLCLSEPVPNTVLAPLQELPERLSNIYFQFISYISRNFNRISSEIAEYFLLYRASRCAPDAVIVPSERLAEIGFILHTTLRIFLKSDLNLLL